MCMELDMRVCLRESEVAEDNFLRRSQAKWLGRDGQSAMVEG